MLDAINRLTVLQLLYIYLVAIKRSHSLRLDNALNNNKRDGCYTINIS